MIRVPFLRPSATDPGFGALVSAALWYRTSRVAVAPSHDGLAIAVSGRF